MNDDEIIRAIFYFISSLGGGGVLIWTLSNYLGKIWADKLLIKYKSEKDLEIEKYKNQLDRLLGDYNRFSGKKFEIIQETWEALFSLVEELKIYPKNPEMNSVHLAEHVQIASKYLTIIKKNSLYFSNTTKELLEKYLFNHSLLISLTNQEINKAEDLPDFNKIMQDVEKGAKERDEILDEIKIEFRKELNFNDNY
ncbi:MAG: hypothetical protein PHF49_02970 [Patescibacteria group bacterium]|nr:hypothetical protein [Patescibacteria group bacterium]